MKKSKIEPRWFEIQNLAESKGWRVTWKKDGHDIYVTVRQVKLATRSGSHWSPWMAEQFLKSYYPKIIGVEHSWDNKTSLFKLPNVFDMLEMS